MKQRSKYLDLFLVFLKIGAFTFGGGYAMIPLIKREIVEGRGWIKDSDMLDIIAVAESTPGPLAINSATFVGYQTAGTLGALMATIGVVLPSFLIILSISFVLKQFEELKAVRYAFDGIRAGVLVLIMSACYSLFEQCKHDWFNYVLITVSFILVGFLNFSAIAVLIMCAVTGIVFSLYTARKEKQ